jgi:bacterioferritin (cytochrome b1)
MAHHNGWREKIRGLFRLFSDGRQSVDEILAERYIEETHHAQQLSFHAERMQYPQFREKLRAMAAVESDHARWIAEKIRSLGGTPPDVPGISFQEKNSWQYLLADLEEHRQCAGDLLTQINMLWAEFPGVADTLQRIYDDSVKHRQEIREMLMRSDPQAHLAA